MEGSTEGRPDAKPATRREGKRSRRDAAHAATRPAVPRVKRTVVLSAEASSRLDAHALGLGIGISEVVEQLVTAGCRRFHLTDRGGGNLNRADDPNGEVN